MKMMMFCQRFAIVLLGLVSVIAGKGPRSTGCFKCSPESTCLRPQLLCDFSRDCPGGEDEAEAICQHSSFGSVYTVSIDDPILVHAADNKPIRVASTNTWFSLYRFTGPQGSHITFDFIDIAFTDNTKRASRSFIASGSGDDPAAVSAQNARISPGATETPTGTHAYSSGTNVAWMLLGHPKGEKVDFTVRISAVSGDAIAVQSDSIAGSNRNQQDCFCVSKDLGCVQTQWVCDGTPDCDDGSDEIDCPCDGFSCSDGWCIPPGFVCDGFDDCTDRDDEENCAA